MLVKIPNQYYIQTKNAIIGKTWKCVNYYPQPELKKEDEKQ